MTAVDIEMHPLWQVTTTDHHLVLSVDHVLVDGRGVANLLSALLSPSIDDLPHEAFSTVPLFEESIDIRPSYAHFVPIVWKKIILPRLPAFVQRYFKVPEPWPDTNFSLTPKECRSDNSLLSIPSDVVERVKTAGKGKSVPTLHPIIEFAFLVAIWSVFGRTHPSFFLSSSTPRSERDTNLGHSYCTVNYTSSSEYTLPLSPSDGFWTLAQTMSTYLRSDVGRKKALWGVGMLAFVPDPPKAVPTGWETFLSEQAERPHPFRASLSISNLGYVALPNGASDLAWSQTCASIFAPGFSVSLLGHVGGLRVVSSWREGAAVTRNEAMRVETAFGEVLQRLGDTTWEATTLSELVA